MALYVILGVPVLLLVTAIAYGAINAGEWVIIGVVAFLLVTALYGLWAKHTIVRKTARVLNKAISPGEIVTHYYALGLTENDAAARRLIRESTLPIAKEAVAQIDERDARKRRLNSQYSFLELTDIVGKHLSYRWPSICASCGRDLTATSYSTRTIRSVTVASGLPGTMMTTREIDVPVCSGSDRSCQVDPDSGLFRPEPRISGGGILLHQRFIEAVKRFNEGNI
jgi:hypothetical protein